MSWSRCLEILNIAISISQAQLSICPISCQLIRQWYYLHLIWCGNHFEFVVAVYGYFTTGPIKKLCCVSEINYKNRGNT